MKRIFPVAILAGCLLLAACGNGKKMDFTKPESLSRLHSILGKHVASDMQLIELSFYPTEKINATTMATAKITYVDLKHNHLKAFLEVDLLSGELLKHERGESLPANSTASIVKKDLSSIAASIYEINFTLVAEYIAAGFDMLANIENEKEGKLQPYGLGEYCIRLNGGGDKLVHEFHLNVKPEKGSSITPTSTHYDVVLIAGSSGLVALAD